jgi:hypothetical protein
LAGISTRRGPHARCATLLRRQRLDSCSWPSGSGPAALLCHQNPPSPPPSNQPKHHRMHSRSQVDNSAANTLEHTAAPRQVACQSVNSCCYPGPQCTCNGISSFCCGSDPVGSYCDLCNDCAGGAAYNCTVGRFRSGKVCPGDTTNDVQTCATCIQNCTIGTYIGGVRCTGLTANDTQVGVVPASCDCTTTSGLAVAAVVISEDAAASLPPSNRHRQCGSS